MTSPSNHTERSWAHHVVPVEEATQVGEARRLSHALALDAGMSELDAGRVTLVVNELATNLVRYARAGSVLLRRSGDDGVEIIAVDEGPGMSLTTSMRDGHSTASSRGVGLGAVARASDVFDGWSDPRLGTVLLARIVPRARRPSIARPRFDVGAVASSSPPHRRLRDVWAVHQRSGHLALGIIAGVDGDRASALATLLEERGHEPASSLLERARTSSGAARGAVFATIDDGDDLTVAGVGDVAVALMGPASSSEIHAAGATASWAQKRPFAEGALLVVSTGGSPRRSPELAELAARHHPALSAAAIWQLGPPGRCGTVLAIKHHA